MTINEIYNLIIAAVPSLTAIVTVFILAARVIAQLVNLKTSIKNNTDISAAQIAALRAENEALKQTVKTTQKQLNQLTRAVSKVLDRIEISDEEVKDN